MVTEVLKGTTMQHKKWSQAAALPISTKDHPLGFESLIASLIRSGKSLDMQWEIVGSYVVPSLNGITTPCSKY
eukprot:1420617-Amphidinium_carterae.2